MDSVSALTFNRVVFWPAIINGVTTAGLYGLVAVALVLSYRISRTVAFLHGGIVMVATLLFWYLCSPNVSDNLDANSGQGFGIGGGYAMHRPDLPIWPVVIALMAGGAVIAAGYGFVVTSTRMANYPKVTQTNFSLALMLMLIGLAYQYNRSAGEITPSPFGAGKFRLGVEVVTVHQVMTLVILAAVVIGFTILLVRTRVGIYVRAIADNVEASKLVGVPIGPVGTTVYATSGAISALGGVLLGNYIGTGTDGILVVFLRALMVCVIGAFLSIPLALAGAVVLAMLDTMLKADVFGDVSFAWREVVVVAFLFAVVILVDRFGKKGTSVIASR